MSDSSSETRREVLVTAAALAMTAMTTSAVADEKVDPKKPAGKPGDFDFLAGEWKSGFGMTSGSTQRAAC